MSSVLPSAGVELPADALAGLADVSEDGLALLDRARRFVYVNAAGARILEGSAVELIGQPALVFAPDDRDEPDGDEAVRRRSCTVPGPDGPRVIERTEETRGAHTLVAFRDVTGRRRRERQLAAFAQTAAAITGQGALQGVLDEVASALLDATGTAACTVVLVDETTGALDRIGTAGGYPADYAERLAGCIRRGARLPSADALRTRGPVVRENWARRVLDDPRWSPMHPVLAGRDWGWLVALPLLRQERAIGSLTVFYRRGSSPTEGDLAFLASVAGQVAVAVHNHRLISTLERKVAVEERNRIARELHDSVSQALFSLRLQAQAVRLANDGEGDDRRERTRAGLDAIQQLTERALTEMRALILQLRPGDFREDGIGGAIERYAAAVAQRHELLIDVACAADLPALPEDTGVQLFRIVQEALGNVVRHAGATRASVTLGAAAAADDRLMLTVADDGRGFDPRADRDGHLGLRTMRERSEELGGRLGVESTAAGTQVTVVFDPRVVVREGGAG